MERGADIEFMPIPVEGQNLKTMLDVFKASLAKEEELSKNLVEVNGINYIIYSTAFYRLL